MPALTRGLAPLALAALLSACAAGTAPPGPATRDSATVVDPDELVALAPGPASAARLADEADRRGYALTRSEPLPHLDRVLLTLRLPAATDASAAIRALERAAPASVVGRNHAYRPGPEAAAARPAEPRTYAGALVAWPAGGCAAAVPVGMIDTPLDPAAPGLAGARVVARDFTGGAPADPHGAAVAELLAGPGRLTGVRLYHAAVVGPGSGDEPAAGVDDLLRAFDWLVSEDVRLVNVSLAGPYNKILDRGLAAAAERGMVIVAAAGNDGRDAPPRWPAASPAAIAVTAVDADLAPYRHAPRGAWLDFAAPGVDVYVPFPGGGRYLSGTSIATPFVTAIAAAGAGPDGLGGATGVRDRLARDSRDLGDAGPDDTFGAGLPTAAPACRATDAHLVAPPEPAGGPDR